MGPSSSKIPKGFDSNGDHTFKVLSSPALTNIPFLKWQRLFI